VERPSGKSGLHSNPPRYLGGYTEFLRERVSPAPSGIQTVVIVIARTGFRLALRLAGMTK